MEKIDYVGWDVGGAHLKAARLSHDDVLQHVAQTACPLWRGIDRLAESHREIADGFTGACVQHAVTMTGELVDCFDNRAAGVAAIVAAMRRLLGRPFAVYAGDAGLVSEREAAVRTECIASANWHATAAWIAAQVGEGLLMDVGSTTTDLVPFKAGGVCAQGFTDEQRLLAGELVYTGVVRTPVMAIADHFPVGGMERPVVAELFAVAADVYRVLGELPERADRHPACDGGEKTAAGSARRLARMFGCDLEGDPGAWRAAAQAVAGVQQRKLADAVARLVAREGFAPQSPIVGAGVGCFLAKRIAASLARPWVHFDQLLGGLPAALREQAVDCATAVSLAGLAKEEAVAR